MKKTDFKARSRRHRGAFTLVEMLVVIAIMSILMTAGAIGLGNMGGKGVTSGVASAESLFQEARAIAVGKNIRTCVMVAKTLDNNPAESLRRIIVASEEVDANGLAVAPTSDNPRWEITSRGITLPDQTFFSQEYSKEHDAGGTGPLVEIQDSQIKGVRQTFRGSYYVYRFNSQGVYLPNKASPNGEVYPASFVIGSGARPSATSRPKVTSAGKRDFGGFMTWRNGNTSIFRSPTQISSQIKDLKPGDEF